jgi:hypothetical protein
MFLSQIMAKKLQVSASGLCIINKRLIISVSVNCCYCLLSMKFVDSPKELTASNTTELCVHCFNPPFSKTIKMLNKKLIIPVIIII